MVHASSVATGSVARIERAKVSGAVFSHPIHHMRGIAILPIVAGHCYNALPWPPGSFGAHAAAIWIELNILFIFISGYLFQHLSARYAYGAYLKTKARTVVLPYLILSIPALAFYLLHLKAHPFIEDRLAAMGPIEEFLFLIATGTHLGPYWFVPMMVVLYLISPLLVYLDRHPAGYFVIVPLYMLAVTILLRPLYDANPPLAAAHYLPVYLLGMLTSHHSAAILPWLRDHWLGMALAAASMLVIVIACSYGGEAPPRIAMSTIICLAVLAVTLRFADTRIASLDMLARYSFGIFLVHGYFVAMLRTLVARNPAVWHGSVPMFLLSMGVVLLASILTVGLVRVAFGKRSRWVIGA